MNNLESMLKGLLKYSKVIEQYMPSEVKKVYNEMKKYVVVNVVKTLDDLNDFTEQLSKFLLYKKPPEH